MRKLIDKFNKEVEAVKAEKKRLYKEEQLKLKAVFEKSQHKKSLFKF